MPTECVGAVPQSEAKEITTTVSLVFSSELMNACDKIKPIEGRTNRVFSLLSSTGLLPKLRLHRPSPASDEQLGAFHSSDYIQFAKDVSEEGADLEKFHHMAETFGLGYDCPLLRGLHSQMCVLAGGSISAARSLVAMTKCSRSRSPSSMTIPVAINWCGGWHHAQRDAASGFCYVNDIVLAIHELRKAFDKVLYVDLDVHHGDGVENAFAFSPKVFTLSLHLMEPGFFPGTGAVSDVGFGKGKFHCLNVPLKEGIGDEKYFRIFAELFDEVLVRFRPDAIVCQCGADMLAFDPMGGFNLTLAGVERCVRKVLEASKPTLMLGGGGYVRSNAARLWTRLTALAVNMAERASGSEADVFVLPEDIPDEDAFFTEYGPSFEFDTAPGQRKDMNDQEYVSNLMEAIKDS